MQKQPFRNPETQYAPIELDPDFPISGADHIHHQTDRPITRLHLHDCLEVGYCHSGSGIFAVEDKVMSFRAGDVSIINDREWHIARSAKGSVSEWTFLSLDPLRLVGLQAEARNALSIGSLGGPAFVNILSGQEHGEIAHLVRAIIAELNNKKAGHRLSVRGLVLTLLTWLRRLPGVSSGGEEAAKQTGSARLAPALRHMAENFAGPVRIQEPARLCHVSVTHFRRLFQRTVGQSPLQYLTRLRVQMGAVLLQTTDRTVLDISMEVGYPTLSSFNRNFKAVMGLSPREWRKR